MHVDKWKNTWTSYSRAAWMNDNGYTPGYGTKSAYLHYSWQGDGMMNWLLRGGGIIPEFHHKIPNYRANIDTTKKEIETLTNDIAKHKIKDPISVNRGFTTVAGAVACLGLNISENDLLNRLKNDDSFKEGLVGYTFRENGFMSTSVADGFNGRIQLEINCPAGTQGTYMASASKFSSEKEFLLQRGTQLAITGVRKDGNNYVLETSVISQEPQPVPDDYFEAQNPNVPSKYDLPKKKPEPKPEPPKPVEQPKPVEPPAENNYKPVGPPKDQIYFTNFWWNTAKKGGKPVSKDDIIANYSETTEVAGVLANFSDKMHSDTISKEFKDKIFKTAQYEMMLQVFGENLLPSESADILGAIVCGAGSKYEALAANFKANAIHMKKMYEMLGKEHKLSEKFGADFEKKIDDLYPKAPPALKWYVATELNSPTTSAYEKDYLKYELNYEWAKYKDNVDSEGHVIWH